MNSTTITATAAKGELICRAADWTDVAKFFINYALHTVTTLRRPGDTTSVTIFFALQALFIPASGVARAVASIGRCARLEGSDLAVAQKAGALCTLAKLKNMDKRLVIPEGLLIFPGHRNEFQYSILHPSLVNIHGEYPVVASHPGLDTYHLIRIPYQCKVESFYRGTYNSLFERVCKCIRGNPQQSWQDSLQLLDGLSAQGHIESYNTPILSNNYSLAKSLAGILQTLYSSYELYHARGRQLEMYGYAAFSLTVVPYISMSILNLLATICEPDYPCMYLVDYQSNDGQSSPLNNKLRGTVGIAHEPRKQYLQSRSLYFQMGMRGNLNTASVWAAAIIGVCAWVAPFIVMAVLSGYEPGQSTIVQREWIIVWLIAGLLSGFGNVTMNPSELFENKPKMFLRGIQTLITSVLGAGVL